ncbi:hypothetical protein SPRI_5263 [Streptomyces pristinaespiralis]|uniref:Uncharacterized protein n=1 Tax=Streptomyces pristinaespiralis TaxID=38300 RepID=A0A0M3QJN8_STRPR|nr:hypothetical protein SPRI_5263 [Streptomyces pristinaespiralis]
MPYRPRATSFSWRRSAYATATAEGPGRRPLPPEPAPDRPCRPASPGPRASGPACSPRRSSRRPRLPGRPCRPPSPGARASGPACSPRRSSRRPSASAACSRAPCLPAAPCLPPSYFAAACRGPCVSASSRRPRFSGPRIPRTGRSRDPRPLSAQPPRLRSPAACRARAQGPGCAPPAPFPDLPTLRSRVSARPPTGLAARGPSRRPVPPGRPPPAAHAPPSTNAHGPGPEKSGTGPWATGGACQVRGSAPRRCSRSTISSTSDACASTMPCARSRSTPTVHCSTQPLAMAIPPLWWMIISWR